jgi:tetratricopeptide (TPR) repeat protein
MTDIAIILLFWAMLFIIAFVFIPLWRKRHDADAGLYRRSQDDNKLSLNYALKQLNCKVRWERDHDDLIARYVFQNGRYRIRLEKDSPYVRLSYSFIYETDLSNLELVRNIINQCNMNTETCRLVYTLDEKSGVINVHIVSALLLTDSTVREVLERAMANAFKWQNTFVRKYQELEAASKNIPNRDPEKNMASWMREVFLLREQEMMHQDGGPEWHEQASEAITLSRLLASVMGLSDIVPLRLSLTRDTATQRWEDADEILAFPVSSPLIAEGSFSHLSALAQLEYYDPRNPVRLRRMSLLFEQDGKTPETLYYRITLALSPLSVDTAVSSESLEAQRTMNSVLLGYDLTPSNQRLEQFRYLWKEAMGKLKAGDTEHLTEDERLLCEVQSPHLAQAIVRGKVLYEQKRFYEAVLLLEDAFHSMLGVVDTRNRPAHDAFYEVCYLVGSCYVSLHQYQRACYYLQLTLPLRRITYTVAYINCLVNGDDFRAMAVINELLFELQVSDEEGSAEVPVEHHAQQSFHSFLKRRKAYLLVKKGSYDEAEKLLKQLLDDPENSSFALNELAYIQKIKEK